MVRVIPRKTKVKSEFIRGVTGIDVVLGIIFAAIAVVLIIAVMAIVSINAIFFIIAISLIAKSYQILSYKKSAALYVGNAKLDAFVCFGIQKNQFLLHRNRQPAVIAHWSFRPIALRPCLSTSLPIYLIV